MLKKNSSWLFLAAGIGLIIGSLLPWATLSAGFISLSKNGTSGDGIITLIFGLLLLAFGIYLLQREAPRSLVIIGSGIALLSLSLSVYEMADLPDPTSVGSGDIKIGVVVQIGIGLWICLIASIAGLVAAALSLFGRDSTEQQDDVVKNLTADSDSNTSSDPASDESAISQDGARTCPNGHTEESQGTYCSQCGEEFMAASDQAAQAEPLGTESTRPKWLIPVAGGILAAMVLGLVIFLAIPSDTSGAQTKALAFHYVYPGKKCDHTYPVKEGNQVDVTTRGGKLLTTGILSRGINTFSNGIPTCHYTVRVIVPTDAGAYYLRAIGDRHVYVIRRSEIDHTHLGWIALSTVAAGVAVVAWSGSAFAAS